MITQRHAILLALCLAVPYVVDTAVAQPGSGRVDETLLVTGRVPDGALAEEVALTPGGITLIDAESLRARNVASLADLLRYVPGVWSANNSGNDGVFISSRGSNLDATDYDMNGVKLLQDGLPVTTADGNNHNRVLDPLSAQFAIIARGANALQYGASTLGGAVNFVSPTARDGAPADVFLNAGSHGQRLARATFAGVANERFDGLVTLETKRWDGYRAHNEQRREGLYANAGWRIGEAVTTRFFATLLDNDQELPGTLTRAQVDADPRQASTSAVGGNFQVDVSTLRLANKTRFELAGGGSVELGFSYESQKLFHPIVDKVMVDFDGPGPAPPVEVFSLLIDTDHRDLGAIVRYRRQVGDHDLLLGFGYGDNSVEGGQFRNDGGRPNGLTTLVDNAARSLELYAVDRWRMSDSWLVELAAQGVAAERNVRNTTVANGALRNPAGDYSSVSPRVGAIFDFAAGAAFYTNLSRLFEPPTNFELEDEASGGGALLDAMSGTVLEAGVRGGRELRGGSRFSWDVAVYHARIDDEILSVDDPGAPGTSLSANVERTVHAGVEAVLAAELALGRGGAVLAPILSVTLNEFSFDGHAIYGSNDLPAAPGYVVRGELIYRHPSGVYVGPTFDLVDDRFADFMNTYRVPSYTLVGLRAGWANERWRAFADLRNLRDDAFIATHAVRNVAAADAPILNPGEPRSAYFGVQRKF